MREHRQRYRDRHGERDRALRIENAQKQNEKRAEQRRLDRLATGLDALPAREPRWVDGERLCTACRRRKPPEEFPAGNIKDGLSCYCRDCTNRAALESQRRASADDRLKKRQRYSRKYDLKRAYGIEYSEFEEMAAGQGGKCAICLTAIDLLAPRSLNCAHVDHDHATGAVRGLLCRACNHGLGNFRDNKAFLMAAIAYLDKLEDMPG